MAQSEKVILERRLKPIYEALDNDNAKKALQEADRVLSKHPGTTAAKVLKALCLFRGDRMSEAIALVQEVDVPGAKLDEATLQALSHCYKEADSPGKICTLYERVVSYAPTEQNYTTLFLSYVRMRNFTGQYTTAVKLYKDYGKVPHAFWGVMSVVMQAISNPQLALKMYYPLALKMIEAQLAKGSHQACGEVELHATVLEGLERYTDAIEILSNPEIGGRWLNQPAQRTAEQRLNLLYRGGKYAEVINSIMNNQVAGDLDNWALWTTLFDSLFAALSDSSVPEDQKKKWMEDLLTLLTKSCNYSINPPLRGPHLARLELLKRLKISDAALSQDFLEKFEDPVQYLIPYVKMFFKKPCCFTDVSTYLSLLDEKSTLAFCTGLEEFVTEHTTNSEPNTSQDEMCKAAVIFECLRRRLGITQQLSREDQRKVFSNIVQSVMKPGVSEVVAGQLLQAGAAILWDLYQKHGDHQAFFELILCLEWASLKFKNEPFVKLILLRTYADIAVLTRMIALVKALDIKSVQRDTLGYVLFPMYELCGRFSLGVVHFTELSDVYTTAERETAECLIMGYRNGSFGQIPKIVALLERLDKSSQAAAADLMNGYISGLFIHQDAEQQAVTLHRDDEWINWSTRCDNRDLNVLKCLEPDDIKGRLAEMKRITHQELIDSLCLRDSIAKAIAAVGNTEASFDELDKKCKILAKYLDVCQHEPEYQAGYKESKYLQSPSPLHLASWAHSGVLVPLRLLLSAACECVGQLEKNGKVLVTALPSEDEMKKSLKNALPEPMDVSKPFNVHPTIRFCSRALQSLAGCYLIIKLLILRVDGKSKNQTSKQKGKQKDKLKTAPSPFEEQCLLLRKQVNETAHELKKMMIAFASQIGDQKNGLIPEVGSDLPEDVRELLLDNEPTVRDRIFRSYGSSFCDMQATITSIFK